MQRALRAANELREHDIACAVMQAGPTSLSRCAELSAREDAARAAVGTPGEAAAFASLQSLVGAERRRIHRLYYCTLLRCMVMPLRFACLRNVQSTPKTLVQQPVPERFRAEDGDGQAYFEWLHREIEKIKEPFLDQITSAVHRLNKANWPTDLGLLGDAFPYRIWRGAARAMMTTKETRYPGELVAYSDRANT